jgi:hypothetical protein
MTDKIIVAIDKDKKTGEYIAILLPERKEIGRNKDLKILETAVFMPIVGKEN